MMQQYQQMVSADPNEMTRLMKSVDTVPTAAAGLSRSSTTTSGFVDFFLQNLKLNNETNKVSTPTPKDHRSFTNAKEVYGIAKTPIAAASITGVSSKKYTSTSAPTKAPARPTDAPTSAPVVAAPTSASVAGTEKTEKATLRDKIITADGKKLAIVEATEDRIIAKEKRNIRGESKAKHLVMANKEADAMAANIWDLTSTASSKTACVTFPYNHQIFDRITPTSNLQT
jgi:hypothetical protein